MRIKSMYFSHNFRFFKSGQSLMIPISGNFRNSSRDHSEYVISISHACIYVISEFISIDSVPQSYQQKCMQTKGLADCQPDDNCLNESVLHELLYGSTDSVFSAEYHKCISYRHHCNQNSVQECRSPDIACLLIECS